jgi:hypothetical protein
MTTEIKFNLKTAVKQRPKINLLKSIESSERKLTEPVNDIDDFDYYSIIERDGNNFIVMCWNEGDKLENVRCYIAEHEEIENEEKN